VPIAGGQPPVPLTPGPVDLPNGVVVRGGTVYFASQGDPSMFNGYVASVPVAGGGPVTILSPNQWGPEQLDVDATNVYFTNFDYGGNMVMMAPLSGAGPTTVLAQKGLVSPFGIVVGGSNVYVFDRNAGAIYAIPIVATPPDGGVTLPPPICTDPNGGNFANGTGNLVKDATNLYWVNAATGIVYACPLDGSNKVTPLVTGLLNPEGLAQDMISLYVCDGGNNRLLRINK
jgi:hypothetical protein